MARDSMTEKFDFQAYSLGTEYWYEICLCGGPGKLRSYWEQEIHVIVEQKGDLTVYEVRPEGQSGKSKALHITFLLP